MVVHRHTLPIVVFHEPEYPQGCTPATLSTLLPDNFQTADAMHLAASLDADCKLLVSFHGPYFPKAAWTSLHRFLERGGHIAFFGGMPFACPVTDTGEIEPEQDAYTRQLYLGPFFQISLPETPLSLEVADGAAFLQSGSLSLSQEQPGTFWAFYPKLSQKLDHPEEIGSAGPIDTLLEPLIFATALSAYGKSKIATPALLLDHHSGYFAGGRWLISAWQPTSEDAWLSNAETIRRLLAFAAEETVICEARPLLACYQPGEAPRLVVAARTTTTLHAQLTVSYPGHVAMPQTFTCDFPGSPILQEQQFQLPIQITSGLYRARLAYHLANGQTFERETGFWVWDEALVAASQPKSLTAGRDYFYQGEQLFPVFGTTYMDSRVQRKFLHLPNAARWDSDFAEMKAAGINLIRTGMWTGWRDLMPLTGLINDTMLRAFDAFVLTACAYNIQVIFTFFTFCPPMFEGENPWLDPRSVQAQQEFVAAFARRYAAVGIVSWDLINEPSFGDPKLVFSQRALPNYDRFELAAFRQWLAKRYTPNELQLRWRQTPSELPSWSEVTPPHIRDYSTALSDNRPHNMLKAMDYTFFSQEMFNQWASAMYAAIRAAGSTTLIGVGQDESSSRISPQFYAPIVDYTTTHPWWNNNDLLWDMLLDKTLATPNLIEETGVMLVRDLDGRPWRTEQENAHLLERKLFIGLAARGAGLIQWLWHTNALMDNDNECSIGLVRTDGSAKPELAVMLAFGRLMAELQTQLDETATPDVWLVIPYSQWFIRPDLGIEATRHAVHVLGYDLGIIPQLVSEQQLHDLLRTQKPPRAIILPGIQTLEGRAWQAVCEFARCGTTVLVSGVIARDPYNLPINPELTTDGTDTNVASLSRYELFTDLFGKSHQLSFSGDKIGTVRKAHNQISTYRQGEGRIIWCGLPLELADQTSITSHVYQQALHQSVRDTYEESSLLLVRRSLKAGTLILFVSEQSSDQHVALEEGIEVVVAPNRAGAIIVGANQSIATFGGVQLVTGKYDITNAAIEA